MASDTRGANGADDEAELEVKVTDHRSASNLDDDATQTSGDGDTSETAADELEDLKSQVAQLDARRQDVLNRLTRAQADSRYVQSGGSIDADTLDSIDSTGFWKADP